MEMVRRAAADLQARLAQAQTILVITHVGPDGDAIGSLTAAGLALRQLGKEGFLACDDPAPQKFTFLPMVDAILQPPKTKEIQADLIITLDCGDAERMGGSFADLPPPTPAIINIDHHGTNTDFGQLNIVAPGATSTAEMLYHLFDEIGIEVTGSIATCLLTGIVSDTLGFRIPSVSAATVAVTSALMAAGADLATITEKTLNLKPLSTIRLYQKGLNNIRFQDGFLWTVISDAERVAAGHEIASGAGLVNLLGDTIEADVGCVMLEMGDGQVYVSFRCRAPWNVASVAAALGGGGHQLAAGCTLQMPLQEAEKRVVAEVMDQLQRQRRERQAQHA